MRGISIAALVCASVFATLIPARAVIASCYGNEHHQFRTAQGRPYNPWGLTAAHRSFPFGTRLRVTNARNGGSAIVVVNDRGPFVRGRSIDLSLGACRAIGNSGLANVSLQVVR